MECNRDEAVRAKEMAEKKLLERDNIGAKKLALKAHNLYPKLEGLSQFLEVVDVHVAHDQKIDGEVNYYGVLGVDPHCDEETLKKQYRRKALSLHPDKNKSVGADGAFVILSQAWSVLSDKEKRSAYDMKFNIRAPNQTNSFSSQSTPGTATTSQPCSSVLHHPRNTASGNHFQQPASRPCTPPVVGSQYTPPPCYLGSTMHTTPAGPSPQPSLNPTAPTGPPLFPRHRRTPTPAAPASVVQFGPASRPPFQSRFVPSRNKPTSSTFPSRPQTFWTVCNRCRIQFEYQRVYLNQNLLCPRCKQPFLATEMPAPSVNSRSSNPWPIPPQHPGMAAASSGPRSMPHSVIRPSQAASGQPCGEHTKRRHETAVNMERDVDHLMKKSSTQSEHVETVPATCIISVGQKPAKRRRKDSHSRHGSKEGNQRTAGCRSGVKGVKGCSGEGQQFRNVKELSQHEIHAMLMCKAKAEILHRLESEKSDSPHLKKVEKRDSMDASTSDPNNTSLPLGSSTLEETNLDAANDFVSMVVPDANFHNFDNDRVEESFKEGQVWAAYDDDDGMPRYYALIHHVISRSPFKIQISWLNSKTSSEFGPLNWISSGFTKTNGDFRIGKSVVNNRLNSFSHPVKWKKGQRGVIRISPTKGDVWALYRNWSPEWDENTEAETVRKYDLVVVLEGYNEDKGILVAPLVKVAGFTSVFKQMLDPKEGWTIPREEMFRFSHQVPLYMLNGLENENSPKDCYELDPAALPLELLKVMTDAELAETEVSGQPVHNSTVTVEPAERGSFEDTKHLLKYSRRNKGKKVEGNFFQSQQSMSLDAC